MVRPAGLFSNRYTPKDMPDLKGKVAIVVGGSRGIGEAIMKALVQKNAHVHIISATDAHQSDAIEHASELNPSAPSLISTHTVDLGDLSAVKTLSTQLASSLDKLDQLYLIAGVGVAPWGLTKDGLGNHFAINNVSHLLIADILYPLLRKTAEGYQGTKDEGSVRIVTESSELHRAAPSDVKWENLHEVGEGSKDMDPTKLYGRSKLGNIHLASHLSTLIPTSPPVLPIAVHPGAVGTEQQHGAAQSYPILGSILSAVAPAVFMEKEQGAESALWAGTATSLNEQERRTEAWGRYFSEADGKIGTESSQGQDTALAEAFWKLGVKAIREKIGYEVKLGVSEGRVAGK